MSYYQPILIVPREMVILCERYLLERLLGCNVEEATGKSCSLKLLHSSAAAYS